jgi:hypothetical protein
VAGEDLDKKSVDFAVDKFKSLKIKTKLVQGMQAVYHMYITIQ